MTCRRESVDARTSGKSWAGRRPRSCRSCSRSLRRSGCKGAKALFALFLEDLSVYCIPRTRLTPMKWMNPMVFSFKNRCETGSIGTLPMGLAWFIDDSYYIYTFIENAMRCGLGSCGSWTTLSLPRGPTTGSCRRFGVRSRQSTRKGLIWGPKQVKQVVYRTCKA